MKCGKCGHQFIGYRCPKCEAEPRRPGEKKPLDKAFEKMEAQIIICHEFDMRMADGTLYKVTCSRDEMDKLINLIGEENIADVEEL